MVSSLFAGMPSSSVIDRGGRHARVADPHVGGFTSEWWAASPRNGGRLQSRNGWAASLRNGGRLHVGTVGGFTSVPPSDAGLLLLRQAEKKLGICRRLAEAMPDRRDQSRIRHEMAELVMARSAAITCGYKD